MYSFAASENSSLIATPKFCTRLLFFIICPGYMTCHVVFFTARSLGFLFLLLYTFHCFNLIRL
jgi:hypothetical protein